MPVLTRLTLEVSKRILPRKWFAMDLGGSSTVSQRMPVHLTFDDGPHPEYTPRILDELSEFGAKATFFVLGEHANQYPELVRRTLAEGHSVGSHTQSHWSSMKVPVKLWMEDVLRAQNELEDISGEPCRLFRPPYGEITPLAMLGLLRSGIRVIHWSQDTRDFSFTDKAQLPRWFADNPPWPGTILLMHDDEALTSENLNSACRPWQSVSDFLAIPMD